MRYNMQYHADYLNKKYTKPPIYVDYISTVTFNGSELTGDEYTIYGHAPITIQQQDK